MKIQMNHQGDVNVVELEGELDFHSSPELRARLGELTSKQAAKILVNLKKVDYMDSSGIATFVEVFQKTKRYNGRLILAGLTPAVRGIFEIAKLESIFEIAQDVQEAISRFLNSK
ncbi:MAG: Anti-sigma-B factor antagonist [Candidatus Omnitrophica bacterium ADurb.Bin277]|nr:MAG: Anti-sigma-B factor antagonist [Candidatus Omnitrophica bacterium ADurb.Bin277]